MANMFIIREIRGKISKVNYWVIVTLTPFLWPAVSKALGLLSRSSVFTPPGVVKITNALILVSDLESSKRIQVKGIDLTDAVENWLSQSLHIKSTKIVTSLEQIPKLTDETILVVTYDWLSSGNRWRKLFKEIRYIADQARRLNLRTWIMVGDSFDQEYIIPGALLVALTGGSTILQSNTKLEGDAFGLIFSSGPHLWTMPKKNLEVFSSSIPWMQREKSVLVASSGEVRRRVFSKIIATQLSQQNWKIQSTNHQLAWEEYVELSKSSQISITTCWLQQQYIAGSRKTKAKIARTTVTHRVWEGFAAGCVVVTNSNSVFDAFGFVAGIHFIELWSEFELFENIQLPNEIELEKIAAAGHDLFSRIVRSGISP